MSTILTAEHRGITGFFAGGRAWTTSGTTFYVMTAYPTVKGESTHIK
jgi:hypothetical protein